MSANDCRLRILSTTAFLSLAKTRIRQSIAITSTLLLAISSLAQQNPTPTPESDSQTTSSQTTSQTATASAKIPPAGAVTVPAGTSVALVLTHPIESRYIHHGDDIYAQVVSAVTAGNQVVVPPGTLVQGKVQRLGHNGSRGEIHLQSLSIIYPDGYVAVASGPITLEGDQGYALKDPGNGRIAGMLIGPAAGTGLGALIGHSVAPSQGTTLTSSNPPGCTPGSFGCLSSSVTGPPEKGKDTVIGAAIGGGIGFVVGLTLVGTSHHFFLDVGAPVEMVLPHALVLQGDQVADALSDAEKHPTSVVPVAPRPQPPPDTGTCWTPGTPGTPSTDIPGTPAVGGSPGTPPIHIPGTPGTPATPHPCP
jgi:hypothetical protein